VTGYDYIEMAKFALFLAGFGGLLMWLGRESK